MHVSGTSLRITGTNVLYRRAEKERTKHVARAISSRKESFNQTACSLILFFSHTKPASSISDL